MKAFEKMQRIAFLCAESSRSNDDPRPIESEYKFSLPRDDFGMYQLEISMIYNETIEKLAVDLHKSMEKNFLLKKQDYVCTDECINERDTRFRHYGHDLAGAVCREKLFETEDRVFHHNTFDNTYIVFTIVHRRTKRKQQHYFRLIDFMELGELVSAAYNGSINQSLNYQSKQFTNLQKSITEQCYKNNNLMSYIYGVAFGDEAEQLTPKELDMLSEWNKKRELIEQQALQSRKMNHSPVKIYEKTSCSGFFSLPPVTYQTSLACSSCIVEYTPNQPTDKPVWKIVIIESFAPIVNPMKDKFVIDRPLEFATSESQGLLLTTRNFYHIIKIVDAILLRWIEGQL